MKDFWKTKRYGFGSHQHALSPLLTGRQIMFQPALRQLSKGADPKPQPARMLATSKELSLRNKVQSPLHFVLEGKVM